jgi:transcriptional regulator GlxA family with amidase domain
MNHYQLAYARLATLRDELVEVLTDAEHEAIDTAIALMRDHARISAECDVLAKRLEMVQRALTCDVITGE